MQILTQKYLKRLADAGVWLDAHQMQLNPALAYSPLRGLLTNQEAAIEAAFQAQQQSGGQASGGVIVKSQLLAAMRGDIETIARGARAVAFSTPGFETKFPLPQRWGEESTAATARLFAANLADPQNLAPLTDLGLNSNTATELMEDSALYDQYFRDKAGAVQARIEDGTELDEAIAASSKTIDTLDAIVHFVFENDKATIASWKEAKRLEKQRAHRPTPSPAP